MTRRDFSKLLGATFFGQISPTVDAYYVDSVNGSDSNNGLSPSQAFATLTHLQLVDSGQPKNHWRLVGGSHFKETLTPLQSGIVIDSYGSGLMPILDCSDVALNSTFSLSPGQSFTYQSTVTVAEPGVSSFISVWENNVRLVQASSIANCDATPGSYFSSSQNVVTSPTTLYVHASDSSNVITNGKLYEFSSRQTGISNNGGIPYVANGIEGRRNLGYGGSLRLSAGGSLYNCIARDGTVHNIFIQENCVLENVSAIGCAAGGLDITMFIWYMDNPSGGPIYFTNCVADPLSFINNNVGGFGGHAGAGSFGEISFDSCTANNFPLAFSGGPPVLSLINCTALNCTQVVACNSGGITNIVGGTFSSTHSGAVAMIALEAGSDAVINISGGAVFDAGATAGVNSAAVLNILSSAVGVSLSIQNCTLQNYIYGVRWNDSGSFTCLNNSMTASGGGVQHIGFVGVVATQLNSDFNTFSGGDSTMFQYDTSGAISLTAWRTITGQDTHSTP